MRGRYAAPATKPPEDDPIIDIPARRVHKPERELAEKQGHVKITSGRRAAHTRIQAQEAEDEMRQVLRQGSGTEYLESCPWCAVRGCEGDCRPGKS